MVSKKTGSYQRSQGAVLIVSLILLMIMTLIGVAAIDTSSLQSQMSRNSLYARNLYQKSLSEIEAQYEKMKGSQYLTDVLTASPLASKGNDPGVEIADTAVETYDAGDPYSQSVVISFSGNGPPPSGYSLGLFIGKNFEVDSISSVSGTGSQSDQTQGMNYPAPAND